VSCQFKIFLFVVFQSSIAKGPLILYISSFFLTFIVKKFNKVVGDKVRLTSILSKCKLL